MRIKFLVLILAMGVMLMGAGYAYWIDRLTITNTVSTGELDVYFVDHKFMLDENVYGDISYSTGINGETNGTVSIMLKNMYPGAKATIDLYFRNDSTIPVELESADLTGVSGDWSQFEVVANAKLFNEDGAQITINDITPDSLKGIHIQRDRVHNIQYTITAKAIMSNDSTETQTYTATVSPIIRQFNQ